jgi:hypothetical protein
VRRAPLAVRDAPHPPSPTVFRPLCCDEGNGGSLSLSLPPPLPLSPPSLSLSLSLSRICVSMRLLELSFALLLFFSLLRSPSLSFSSSLQSLYMPSLCPFPLRSLRLSPCAGPHARRRRHPCVCGMDKAVNERDQRERDSESAQEAPGVAEASPLALGAAVERGRERLKERET